MGSVWLFFNLPLVSKYLFTVNNKTVKQNLLFSFFTDDSAQSFGYGSSEELNIFQSSKTHFTFLLFAVSKNILKKFFFKIVVFKLANTHKIFNTFYQHIFSKQAFFSILNEDFLSRNWMTPIPFVGSSHRDFAIFMKLKIREKIKWTL